MTDEKAPLTLQHRFGQVLTRLEQGARQCQRPVPALLAVSKKKPVEDIRTLYRLGQRRFGESYVQEAVDKIQALSDLDIEWHFIGPIQSNKTRTIAEHFQWVHSLEREKIARRLNDQRPADLPPLKVCIQVNIDAEDSKSGVTPQQVLPLAKALKALPRLSLEGLMCIPDATPAPDQTDPFQRLAALAEDLKQAGVPVSTLSMGMSSDLETAIAAGSTLVRVGTALFGAR